MFKLIDVWICVFESIKAIGASLTSEINELAAYAGKPPLLPPEIETAEGTITVRDKHGNIIGTYRIEDGNLELALQQIHLSPIESIAQ